jgi:hypothetical protein
LQKVTTASGAPGRCRPALVIGALSGRSVKHTDPADLGALPKVAASDRLGA